MATPNPSDISENYRESFLEVCELIELTVDLTGFLQKKLLMSGHARHADVVLNVRNLLGQVFDVPVVETSGTDLDKISREHPKMRYWLNLNDNIDSHAAVD